MKSLFEQLNKWGKAINLLKEIIDDPNFDSKYPGSSKKDIIDLAFEKGSLSEMSKQQREFLRNKLIVALETDNNEAENSSPRLQR